MKGQEFLVAVVPPTIRSCSSALSVRYGPAPQATLVSPGLESMTTGAVLGTALGLDVVLGFDVVISETHHELVVLGLLVELLVLSGFDVAALVGDSGTHQGLVVLGREVVVETGSGTHHGLVVPGREVVVGSGTHHGLVVLGREVAVVKEEPPAPAKDGPKGKKAGHQGFAGTAKGKPWPKLPKGGACFTVQHSPYTWGECRQQNRNVRRFICLVYL